MKTFLLLFVALVFLSVNPQAQVTRINNNKSLVPNFPLTNGKTFLVSSIDSSIWATNGTEAGTIQLSPDITFETTGGLVGGKLVFVASTATTGSELYITDGTPEGTGLVKDIVDGATGSEPADIAFLNGLLYFTAATESEGRELWKSDGTANGTTRVKDIVAGAESSNEKDEYQLTSTGTYLLFAARTATSGIEVWKSDGTENGTVLLKDINLHATADSSSSNPRAFFKFNNIVLFLATDTAHGEELWKTDGSPAGTVLVKDIRTGRLSSTKVTISFPPIPDISIPIFLNFHVFNNKAYFNATNGASNGEIWSTDGTEENTTLLKDVITASFPATALVFLIDAVNLPTKFIFPVTDGQDRAELWESDGTTAGTKLFKAFNTSGVGDLPFIFLSNNYDPATGNSTQPLFQGNKFFFVGRSAAGGRELWISDGVDSSQTHTTIVADINPGAGNGLASGVPSYLFTSTALYFAANNGVQGNELWKTDGTEGGTSMVADINLNGEDSDPVLPFFLSSGKIIFTATDGDDPENRDLFVVDGSFDPLPIRLSEFTVKLKTGDALLQWSTLNETNTREFAIQRSYDGQRFVTIATLPAAGNASAKHDYSFVDRGVSNSGMNVIYYRILTSDKDGKSASTNIIFVKIGHNDQWQVRLLSNPVQSTANLMLSGITGELKLSIKDISGKIVYTSERQNVNGQINIPVSNLQRGIYILSAETNNERKTLRFIKQ